MLTKHLRILIADTQHHNRLNIERLLNRAGCYGIGVAGSIEELMALLAFAQKPFDLVLINHHLLAQADEGTQEALCGCQDVLLYQNNLSALVAEPSMLVQMAAQSRQRTAQLREHIMNKSPSDVDSPQYARQ